MNGPFEVSGSSLVHYRAQSTIFKESSLWLRTVFSLNCFDVIIHVKTPGYEIVEMPHAYYQSVAFTSLILVLRG